MLEWLKGVVQFTSAIENSHNLSRELIDSMARGLGHFKGDTAQYREAALRYVVDGGDGDLPRAIAKSLSSGWSWSSHDSDAEFRKARWEIYDHWEQVPGEVLIRLGTVLAASSAVLNYRCRLDIAQKHPWIDALVLDLLGLPVTHASDAHDRPIHPNASMNRLEALLSSVGLPDAELVVSAFRSARPAGSWGHTEPVYIGQMPGFGASAARHAALVRGAFRAKSFEHRLYALKLIEACESDDLAAFAEELVALSVDSSRQVRGAAVRIAARLQDRVQAIGQRVAIEEKPEQRAYALQLLWQLNTNGARQFVLERGDKDPAESVRKTVPLLVASAEAAVTAPPELSVPDTVVELHPPLSDESRKALLSALEEVNQLVKDAKRKEEETQPKWKRNPKPLSDSALRSIVKQVAESFEKIESFKLETNHNYDKAMKALKTWTERTDVRLAHVVKLLISIAEIDKRPRLYGLAPNVLNHFGRVTGRVSLLELHALFERLGVSPQMLVADWFSGWGRPIASGWRKDAVWPYFAKHRNIIDDALNPQGLYAKEYWFSRARVFDALATFPHLPGDLVPMLFDMALGSAKNDRIGAQTVLEGFPGKEDYLLEALASGKAERRIAAANWLARLQYTDAVPQLEAALQKEKNDAAAGTLMSALESLGVPVEKFLDRDGLVKDAAKGLAKGLPADLQWFPFGQLPPVRWADTVKQVPPEVLKWLVVQSHKLKSPEPGGVLRKYCEAMRPADRETLGVFVLKAWLQQDIKPIDRAEAEKRARDAARQIRQSIKQYPDYYKDSPLKDASEQQIYEAYLPGHLKTPAGSAIASKGVLAVAAACGGFEIAALVQRYLKEWYGTRAAQGKALIQMLAWVEHPSAIQLMLSIGSRFRTKSFQEEATRQAHLLAERRGWTLDELSDRTIPTAGFDESGEATIDYGERKFTARLTAEFDVELYNSEDKKIASLPEARKDEDEAIVKEAKKQFSAAKKELKGVLQLQKDRLYEALCTQRRWRFEDWDLYLNRHPIVRRYCQLLVWRAERPDKKVLTFRPLDDGSVTDLDDAAVTLAPDDTIAIAHDTNTPEETAKGWLAHLRDYKVEPLFQQFGKGVFKLTPERAEGVALEDFKGHLLEAFALRGRASKLGYTRGAAEDGGWFYRYEKRFPTLGIEASIEFTGNTLPEENRTVALTSLSFARKSPETGGRESEKMTLGEVPSVLLSECWNDMRLMAADGPGFDPDWEKKAQY